MRSAQVVQQRVLHGAIVRTLAASAAVVVAVVAAAEAAAAAAAMAVAAVAQVLTLSVTSSTRTRRTGSLFAPWTSTTRKPLNDAVHTTRAQARSAGGRGRVWHNRGSRGNERHARRGRSGCVATNLTVCVCAYVCIYTKHPLLIPTRLPCCRRPNCLLHACVALHHPPALLELRKEQRVSLALHVGRSGQHGCIHKGRRRA